MKSKAEILSPEDLIKKIALGTVQFGLEYGISNEVGQTDVHEAKCIMNFAFQNGIRTLDTALSYGNSEQTVGEIGCEYWQVVTKLSVDGDNQQVNISLKQSLEHLRLNSVYAYLVHNADALIVNPDAWQELVRLKEENKVEKIGYSLYTPVQLERLMDAGMVPDIIQVPFSFVDRRFLKYFPDLKIKGIEIHTRSAFLQGLFFTNVDSISDFFSPVKEMIKALQHQFRSHDLLAAALLKYCLGIEEIDKVVIGVNTCVQLRNNIASLKSDMPVLNTDISIYGPIPEDILLPFKWPVNSN